MKPGYLVKGYEIAFDKPGKEYDRRKLRNINDMTVVLLDAQGKDLQSFPDFADLFRGVWELGEVPEAAILMGALLVRNSYMLDHQEMGRARWRYQSPPATVARLLELAPEVHVGSTEDTAMKVPVDIFLYLLEAVALNEDVKYWTLRKNVGSGRGRPNNLRTYAWILQARADEQPAWAMAASMVRGVSPLGLANSIRAFPPLWP
jgi:hypothetical protein